MIAKLDETDISIDDWKTTCTTHFTIADDYYSNIAISVLQSRAEHKIDNWQGVAWVKSDLKCDVSFSVVLLGSGALAMPRYIICGL